MEIPSEKSLNGMGIREMGRKFFSNEEGCLTLIETEITENNRG